MQVNPKIQYNDEDAGLTLDNPITEDKSITEPVEKVESNDAQDEADLTTAEKEQKPVVVEKPKKFLLLSQFVQSRKNDRLFAAGCMATGVISVVAVYFMAVFI